MSHHVEFEHHVAERVLQRWRERFEHAADEPTVAVLADPGDDGWEPWHVPGEFQSDLCLTVGSDRTLQTKLAAAPRNIDQLAAGSEWLPARIRNQQRAATQCHAVVFSPVRKVVGVHTCTASVGALERCSGISRSESQARCDGPMSAVCAGCDVRLASLGAAVTIPGHDDRPLTVLRVRMFCADTASMSM